MNLLAVPPNTYDAAGDPILQWITLGVAALAIAGTVYNGFQQHKLASELWLRSQRKEAYAKYQEIQMRLGNALMRTNAATNQEESLLAHAPYAKAMDELGPVLGTLRIIGSAEVIAACSEQELMNKQCHGALHKPNFAWNFNRFVSSQEVTAKHMTEDLQSRSRWRRRFDKEASRKVVEEMTRIRRPSAPTEAKSSKAI